MEGQTVVIFGGSSGIGAATAEAARRAGARVVIVARDGARLAAAATRIGGIATAVADATDGAAVARVLSEAGAVDHVVACVTGGKGAGRFLDLDLAGLRSAFAAKTIAQLTVAQAAARRLGAGGSITLVTAASARSAIPGTAGLAAVNGALEAAIPVLARELAPIRVNAVSPGVIDTPWWSRMPAAQKEAFFRNAEATLPAGRVGRPEDAARAIVFLMQSGFVTGSVIEVDGGARLVGG